MRNTESITIEGSRKRTPRSQQARLRETSNNSQALFMDKLLSLENEVRLITEERELAVHLCNSTRALLPFRQSFFGIVDTGKKRFRLKNASSIPAIDRDAPFTRWFERMINRMIKETEGTEQLSFTLPQFCAEDDEEKAAYLFKEFLWTPQISNKQLIGGFIVARDRPWADTERALASRFSLLYMHAAAANRGSSKLNAKKRISKSLTFGVSLTLLAALALLPVPITALAPVEVTPKNPFILTAPFDGVVREILPTQGQNLSVGDLAIVFDDVHLLNNKLVAEQRMTVAQAEYQKTTQGAIADFNIKRDIEVAKAEYELAQLESQYATQLFQKSQMKAPVNGVAIFSDKQDWEGKPVSAGEAILSVADPDNVGFTIDLPVKDSLVIENGAKVRIFLDSDPLNPLDAVLTGANYSTTVDKRDVLSYKLEAKLTDTEAPHPRIGVQGTALVFGEPATLGYTILRRPLSAFRQLTGW